MKHRYTQLAQDLIAFLKGLSTRTAVLVGIFLIAFTTLFATRPDVLRLGLATAALPSQTESVDAAEIDATTKQVEQTAEQKFAARVGITHRAIDLSAGTIDIRKLTPLPAQKLSTIDEETLWLARCVYSETKRPEEMELVAWSIRNRVETGYRGNHTYEDVVLDPWQFSAFNSNSPKRSYFMGLTPSSQAEKWQDALTIAHVVKNAPASLRPFSKETRHYYSERSMVGRSQPDWAVGERPIKPNRSFVLEADRFRFFEDIA